MTDNHQYFFKFSNALFDASIDKLSSKEFVVFAYLLRQSAGRFQEWTDDLSLTRISKQLKMDKRTAKTCLNNLQDYGAIIQQDNQYSINAEWWKTTPPDPGGKLHQCNSTPVENSTDNGTKLHQNQCSSTPHIKKEDNINNIITNNGSNTHLEHATLKQAAEQNYPEESQEETSMLKLKQNHSPTGKPCLITDLPGGFVLHERLYDYGRDAGFTSREWLKLWTKGFITKCQTGSQKGKNKYGYRYIDFDRTWMNWLTVTNLQENLRRHQQYLDNNPEESLFTLSDNDYAYIKKAQNKLSKQSTINW